MNSPRWISKRWIAAGLLSVACTCHTKVGFAGELLHLPHHKHPLPNVPPIDELEILDPRVDSEGKPQTQVLIGMNGLKQFETPPTIIVHRFYYTGDREFQGPMLQGGLTLITANDPATGEQVQIEAMLPPGAPRITYRSDKIVYDYRDRAITVRFGHPGPLGLGIAAKPTISVKHHSAAVRAVADHHEQKSVHNREWWSRTGIPNALGEVKEHSKQIANNTADAVQTVGTAATAPIKAAWRATPLGSLTSSQEVQPAFNSTFNR